MAFCIECGRPIADGIKFCPSCGASQEGTTHCARRDTVYEGQIHKCPNCGEVLRSFTANCPTCGYEFRGANASNAVKEFALKLEAIEEKREYEKPRGLFKKTDPLEQISKTDEQKISLIKSFSVPNSKEDMLEFMILATSNINMSVFDSTKTNISKSDREINNAWFSKVKQIYEKAKRVHSADGTFTEIKALYDKCNDDIRKTKKKGIIKVVLLTSTILLPYIVIILFALLKLPKAETAELERLNDIVVEVQQALSEKEYKHALRIASSIDYQRFDIEMERKWDIERDYWVDKVLTEAAADGVELEYTPVEDVDKTNHNTIGEALESGFNEGFSNAVQDGLDEAKKNIDEFNSIMNGKNN